MKIQVSHGADESNWFVVEPMPHEPGNKAQVASLTRVGRSVYELDVQPWLGDQRTTLRDAIAEILIAAVTTDGAHHKQYDLEQIADVLGVELPDHEPGISA